MNRSAPHGHARPLSGFTLVEMLVALLVFAVIAGGALALLRFSVDAELASRAKTEEIASARRFLAVWSADLAQAAPRPVRDIDGRRRAAMEAGGDTLLTLTRSGWSNPAGDPRASLQRVEWRVEGNRLTRAGLPHLDGSHPPEASAMAEIAGSPQLRFRTLDGDWRDRWEPDAPTDLPTAIELSLPQRTGEVLRIVAPVGANHR